MEHRLECFTEHQCGTLVLGTHRFPFQGFLGSTEELIQSSQSYGMAKGGTLQYEATPRGTVQAFRSLSVASTAYRGSKGMSDENFWGTRDVTSKESE